MKTIEIDQEWMAHHEWCLAEAFVAIKSTIALLQFADGTNTAVVRGRATLALEKAREAHDLIASAQLPW